MRVLVIPDLHIPFEHKSALSFLKLVRLKYQTDTTVCVGDEVDMHALSRYVSDPDGFSAGHEYKAAMSKLKKWYAAFPKVLVCSSNHTSRPYRKAFDAGIPKEFIKSYQALLGAPSGWKWADSWEVDGVRYEHGEGFSGMLAHRHIAIARMQSTVIGHVHSNAGVAHVATTKNKGVYGMNAGCLIDQTQYAFAYAKHARTKGSLGCGVVLGGVPYWVPMVVDSKGNWINKV